jgi:hypothetical protein
VEGTNGHFVSEKIMLMLSASKRYIVDLAQQRELQCGNVRWASRAEDGVSEGAVVRESGGTIEVGRLDLAVGDVLEWHTLNGVHADDRIGDVGLFGTSQQIVIGVNGATIIFGFDGNIKERFPGQLIAVSVSREKVMTSERIGSRLRVCEYQSGQNKQFGVARSQILPSGRWLSRVSGDMKTWIVGDQAGQFELWQMDDEWANVAKYALGSRRPIYLQ